MTIEKIIEKMKENVITLKKINSFDYRQGINDFYNQMLPDLESAQQTQNELIEDIIEICKQECIECKLDDNFFGEDVCEYSCRFWNYKENIESIKNKS